MMKKIALLAGVFISATSFGQITINSADLASADDTIRVSYAYNLGNADPTTVGADLTWDFSELVPDSQRLEQFVSVGESPLAYQLAFNNAFLYPEHVSNLSSAQPDREIGGMLTLTNVYGYFDNGSSEYRATGFGANVNGAPLPTRYDTIETVYQFPMNFNDAFESKLYWQASIPTLGYLSQYKRIENEVEAWGTLTLPNGTYPVLKLKKTIQETDSVYVEQFGFGNSFDLPEAVEYHFLTTDGKIPVLKVVYAGGEVTEIVYQDVYDSTIGIENELLGNVKLEVFPNPSTSGVFEVSSSSKIKEISIVNSAGQRIINSNTNLIDLSGSNSGMYFATIIFENGYSMTKKLIKK